MRMGLILGLPLAFFLAGCAAPPYNPHNFNAVQLSPSTLGNDPTPIVYRVSLPHRFTSMRFEDFGLLSSAELTLEKGCQYFVIVRHEDSQVSDTKEGFNYDGPAYIIRVLREKPSAPEIVAYDAAFVKQALRREYTLETVGPLPNRAAGNCGA